MKNKQYEKTFFKYKSLEGESFKYFVQLLLDNKMYAASFKELNDPMEGFYMAKDVDKKNRDIIMGNKCSKRIISMVQKEKEEDKPVNMLMWSHYTDGHKGCCIEFHFIDDNKKVSMINYVDRIDEECKKSQFNDDDINKFLNRKFVDWEYENESRFIGNNKFEEIVIDKIYLGMKIDDIYDIEGSPNEAFYKKLITRLQPELEKKIVVMKAEDFINTCSDNETLRKG